VPQSLTRLRIVSFLHVLEAIIIDVTSISRVGDGYCATWIAQSFYRMPAYKTYSCQNPVCCDSVTRSFHCIFKKCYNSVDCYSRIINEMYKIEVRRTLRTLSLTLVTYYC